jgi:hypothetical protein
MKVRARFAVAALIMAALLAISALEHLQPRSQSLSMLSARPVSLFLSLSPWMKCVRQSESISRPTGIP